MQECWAHAETDQSFIVEILAHEDEVNDAESAVFYFNDIAACNDSHEQSVVAGPTDCSELMRHLLASGPSTDVPVGTPSCWVLQGRQHVAKFKEAEHNVVEVHVAVLRLPNVDSDVVVHYNQPLAIHSDSSSTTLAQVINRTPSTLNRKP